MGSSVGDFMNMRLHKVNSTNAAIG